MPITVPDGWTYNDLRSFIQSEASEDKPGGLDYPNLVDFDTANVILSDDWGGTLYQVSADLVDGDGGKDMVWNGDPVEVAEKTTYVKVAEMAATDMPRIARFSAYAMPEGGEAVTTDGIEYVIKRGTVFEPGDFPDLQFTASAEQMKAAAARFKPVENRVNHVTGQGKGMTPSYFDGNMGELIALSFDDAANKLIGEVKIPKWFDDYHTQHFPGEPLKNSLEIDRVTHDVTGNVLVPNPRVSSVALMSAHAAFAKSGGELPVTKETGDMGKTGTTEKVEKVEEQTVSFAEYQALKATTEAQASQIAAMAASTRETNAASFAVKQATAGKIVPAMADAIKAQYLTAAADDAALGGTVNFARVNPETKAYETVQGSRVAQLESMYENMPVLPMLQEFVDGDHAIVFSQRPDATSSRKAESDAAIEDARKKAEQQRDRQKR